MSAKTQHNNILLAIIGFAAAVAIMALIGFFALGRDPEIIQGQVEVSEYRVSSKVPGRILEIRVKEGDYVKVGDTLAILDAPEVRAKMEQAQSAQNAAAALELKASMTWPATEPAVRTRWQQQPRWVVPEVPFRRLIPIFTRRYR